ncbi:MAG: hypothetical protein ABIF84_01515 [Patescibacteria group bacterium]
MGIGKFLGGLILIAIAIWAFISLDNSMAKLLVGMGAFILGIILLILRFSK